VNPTVARGLLSYVESALGPAGADAVAAHLAARRELGDLLSPNRWWTTEEFADLIVAATAVTGDPDPGRRTGEQVFRDLLGTSLADSILVAGTTEVACAVMADYATRMEPARSIRVVASSSSHVVMEGVFGPTTSPNTFSCGFTRGYFSMLPSLFGNMGTVAEPLCQARGDDLCRFHVTWRPDPSRVSDVPESAEARVQRGFSALEQLESQHQMAARLVESHEIDDVLERIVTSVSGAVGAPQYALAVRLGDGAGRRDHHLGFGGDDAAILIDQLEAGERLGDECLVVPVEHHGHQYGHLIAMFPTGARGSAADERMLASYARFAASAIQIIDAFASARRERDTAQALLELAATLADTGDVETVAANLCAALPGATGCDTASVWLSEPGTDTVSLAVAFDASGDRHPVAGVPPRFAPRALPAPGGVLHGPVVFDATSTAIREIAGPDIEPYAEIAVVPLGSGDAWFGMAVASFAAPISEVDRAQVLSRLRGLADQAGIAFENARLVEVMRHQALHDDLTGLPKRVLAEDRCRLAISRRARTGEEIAVLFIDVDDFKTVNDTLGHAVGDGVLRQLAGRLVGELRSSDTCARVGGDKFVVILTDTAGSIPGDEVAQRVLRSLEPDFEVDGHELDISVSIGIAWASDDSDTFDELVRRADDAMYEAKAAGKGRVSHAE
jgi:diguanylate cyclase (GGDEF)-like protein